VDFTQYDLVVVGAGFFGATVAERAAATLGKRVLLIDRRDHIAGNSYSETDAETGIEIHRYGTHIFHTSNKRVWDYLAEFTSFTDYQHRVFASASGKVYPLPINLGTICQFFGRQFSPLEARDLVQQQAREVSGKPANLEEKAISLIGRPLYEAFIQGYTRKQWQTDPRQLSEAIITRLPVRFDFNNRYFSDTFEGMPSEGYTKIFERMLSNPRIDVRLGTDYFDIKSAIPGDLLTVYTGPVDRFFDFRAGALSWRTIDLELARPRVADFQGTAVINYPDEHVAFTRIHEYRHLHPERSHPQDRTIIAREFSRFATGADEPYYPIDTADDRAKYATYRKMAEDIPNVVFGGRLGTYRYLDMHQAIAAALKAFDTTIADYFAGRPLSAGAHASAPSE
jgi:UDP-galactopyranose mutase